MTLEERLIEIETDLTHNERMLEDLNEVIIRHEKEIEALKKENALLKNLLERETVKPLSEETPPPHY